MNLAERSTELLDRLRSGDEAAVGDLFSLYRDRLWRMIQMRLDRRLSGRIDADDVLQEAFLDVARRVHEYLDRPTVPVYVWIRFLTMQRLLVVHRNHLGAQMRDAKLEVAMPQGEVALASSESMAGQFVSAMTSPSQAAMRHELQGRLQAALATMDPIDREVLALRHFEEMGNQEVAEVLGITCEAASKRHVRALKRLKEIFTGPPETYPG